MDLPSTYMDLPSGDHIWTFHLETIYGPSIWRPYMDLPSTYVLKLHTYYHSITRQTNCTNLNKLATLKMKTA